MAAKKILPRVLAFDLDGCVWDPEMYELWGRGGSPFTPRWGLVFSIQAQAYLETNLAS